MSSLQQAIASEEKEHAVTRADGPQHIEEDRETGCQLELSLSFIQWDWACGHTRQTTSREVVAVNSHSICSRDDRSNRNVCISSTMWPYVTV